MTFYSVNSDAITPLQVVEKLVASSPEIITHVRAAVTASPTVVPSVVCVNIIYFFKKIHKAVREYVEKELAAPDSFLNRALQQNGYQRDIPAQAPAGVPKCIVKFFDTDFGMAAASILTPLANAAEVIHDIIAPDVRCV